MQYAPLMKASSETTRLFTEIVLDQSFASVGLSYLLYPEAE